MNTNVTLPTKLNNIADIYLQRVKPYLRQVLTLTFQSFSAELANAVWISYVRAKKIHRNHTCSFH